MEIEYEIKYDINKYTEIELFFIGQSILRNILTNSRTMVGDNCPEFLLNDFLLEID